MGINPPMLKERRATQEVTSRIRTGGTCKRHKKAKTLFRVSQSEVEGLLALETVHQPKGSGPLAQVGFFRALVTWGLPPLFPRPWKMS